MECLVQASRRRNVAHALVRAQDFGHFAVLARLPRSIVGQPLRLRGALSPAPARTRACRVRTPGDTFLSKPGEFVSLCGCSKKDRRQRLRKLSGVDPKNPERAAGVFKTE